MPKFAHPTRFNSPACSHRYNECRTVQRQIKKKITTYSYSFLARANVGGTNEQLQIAPISPFLVYDGLEKDLDAAEILGRVLAMDREGVGQYTTFHLHQFLLSFL